MTSQRNIMSFTLDSWNFVFPFQVEKSYKLKTLKCQVNYFFIIFMY